MDDTGFSASCGLPLTRASILHVIERWLPLARCCPSSGRGTALLWALLMLRWVVALDVPAGLSC